MEKVKVHLWGSEDCITFARMRVLMVVHGYPPYKLGGSEIYTKTVTEELVRQGHEVGVFYAYENPLDAIFSVTRYHKDGVQFYRLNIPGRYERYIWIEIDNAFREVLSDFKPDLVNIQHLAYLSLSMVEVAYKYGVPIAYTLHDFWLMCPKGQFLIINKMNAQNKYEICDGQENLKCATRCFYKLYAGDVFDSGVDIKYWEQWVAKRQRIVTDVVRNINVFIAPSDTVKSLFSRYFPDESHKVVKVPYGFDLQRLKGRERLKEDHITFGYIGRYHLSKGIDILLDAFRMLAGKYSDVKLRIWGSESTPGLKATLSDSILQLPPSISERIELRGSYENYNILNCLNLVDFIVVPSVWMENSPLVIHEALEAGVPVITANIGGMKELVEEGKNGYLFEVHDVISLFHKLDQAYSDIKAGAAPRARYLHGEQILSIGEHAKILMDIFDQIIKKHKVPWGPWRVTFDTNPDDCNLSCIMCEEHSPYSLFKQLRKENRIPHRRMNISIIEKAIGDLSGSRLIEIIPSTMGEPLLYKDFIKIIEICKKNRIFINITTNGSFPTRDVTYWADEIIPICTDIKFSINGSDSMKDSSIMIGRDFDRFLDNIRIFVEKRNHYKGAGMTRCNLTFQVTLMTVNMEDLPGIFSLAADLDIDRVKAHHIWPHFTEHMKLSIRHSSPEVKQRYNQIVSELYKLAEAHEKKTGKRIIININPLSHTDDEKELGSEGICPFLGKELWIAYDGTINICCAPDYDRKKLGYYGNMAQKSIKEMWESAEYAQIQSHYMNHPVCKVCNMRK